jgi:hypothetical protein
MAFLASQPLSVPLLLALRGLPRAGRPSHQQLSSLQPWPAKACQGRFPATFVPGHCWQQKRKWSHEGAGKGRGRMRQRVRRHGGSSGQRSLERGWFQRCLGGGGWDHRRPRYGDRRALRRKDRPGSEGMNLGLRAARTKALLHGLPDAKRDAPPRDAASPSPVHGRQRRKPLLRGFRSAGVPRTHPTGCRCRPTSWRGSSSVGRSPLAAEVSAAVPVRPDFGLARGWGRSSLRGHRPPCRGV